MRYRDKKFVVSLCVFVRFKRWDGDTGFYFIWVGEVNAGLYYKGQSACYVLVHRFVVDIPKLDTSGDPP
jgi:hypothetical protein